MATNGFVASARQVGPKGVIDLSGEVNRDAEAALATAYDNAIGAGPTTVLLNFSDVTYINSTGIAVIVGLLARARTEGRTIIACGLSSHYRHIFEITRLADFMAIFDSEDSAVADQVK